MFVFTLLTVALLQHSCLAQSDNGCSSKGKAPAALFINNSTFDKDFPALDLTLNGTELISSRANCLLEAENSTATLAIGSSKFRVHSLCYFWSGNNSAGSEHQLEGSAYPLEAQLLLWNSEQKDFASASKTKNNIVSVAWMYSISNAASSSDLTTLAKFFQSSNDSKSAQAPALANLLPKQHKRAFGYSGAVQTPGAECQTTKWYVLADTLTVQPSVMEKLRNLSIKAIQPRIAVNVTDVMRSFHAEHENKNEIIQPSKQGQNAGSAGNSITAAAVTVLSLPLLLLSLVNVA